MYLEIDEGFDAHPKTVRLCRVMGDVNAGQYLIRLWAWACRSAPDGNLSGMEAGDVESIAKYAPADGKLFAALTERWSPKFGAWLDLDGDSLNLHGWNERTGAAISKMDKRAADMRALRDKRKRERDSTVTAPCNHGDTYVGDQTRPDKTSPDQTRPVQSSDQKENSCANPEPAPLALELVPSSKKQRTQRAYTQAFETAWKGYVRGEGKAEAFAEWLKLAPAAGGEESLLMLVQRAMEWQRPKLARDGGKYAVHFCRWLKHRRWEDEPANGSSSGGGLTPEQIANGSWRTQCKPAR